MGKGKSAHSINTKSSLSEETVDKLNRQVQMEALSSYYYLAMASWCEHAGYANSAEFLYQHAEEEKLHMLKLMRFINEAGGHALAPEIKNIKNDFSSLREVYEHILQHEITVTKAIGKLAGYCFETQDFATFNFLQWYVAEQREEEAMARRCLELFELIGEEGHGLWMIEQEIAKIAAKAAADAAAKEAAVGGGAKAEAGA